MSEWREVRLGEILEFQNGYAFSSKNFILDGKTKVIKIKELKDGQIRFFNDTVTVNIYNNNFKRYEVVKNDLLIALTGDPVNKNNPLSWVGRIAIYKYDENALLNQRVCKLIPNDLYIDRFFLYYYLTQFERLYELASKATGSASQANISTKTIAETKMLLPPLHEQKAIADTLSCLDDKIELNNKINENLERQAQAIFKSWFVDFEPFQGGEFEESEMGMIPKGWKVLPLGELCKTITKGTTPTTLKGSILNVGVQQIELSKETKK